MKMGSTNSLLFGEFPRFVGLVGREMGRHRTQFVAFDKGNFELFLDCNYHEHNLYTRVSHIGDEGGAILDKIFIDLDVDKPEEKDWIKHTIGEMKQDRLVADTILGDVVEDARNLATYILENDWPAIAIFSGMGIHIHILTQTKVSPGRALRTTTRFIEDEVGLTTLDDKGSRQGDYNRLCRVANSIRVAEDGTPLRMFLVPLTMEELSDITPEDLLELSQAPREIPKPTEERPDLLVVRPEYSGTDNGMDTPVKEVGDISKSTLDGQMSTWLTEVLKMPCMAERIQTRNPDHMVRFNCAILLFNLGLTVTDVLEIYKRLGWFDWDEDITRGHLENIYNNGYSCMSCQSIQENGLCVYERDDRESCRTYGWKGGQLRYK